MGFSKKTVQTLTGHNAESVKLKQFAGGVLDPEGLAKTVGTKLDAALNPPPGSEKRIVTVLTRPTLKGFYDIATDKMPINANGLVPTHWYAVYGYDATPGQEQVLVRNPWGTLGEYGQEVDKKTRMVTKTFDRVNDGLFVMSLKDFVSEFAMVTFEQPD